MEVTELVTNNDLNSGCLILTAKLLATTATINHWQMLIAQHVFQWQLFYEVLREHLVKEMGDHGCLGTTGSYLTKEGRDRELQHGEDKQENISRSCKHEKAKGEVQASPSKKTKALVLWKNDAYILPCLPEGTEDAYTHTLSIFIPGKLYSTQKLCSYNRF